MNPKTKAIIAILMFLCFFATLFTGFRTTQDYSLFNTHVNLARITTLVVLVHLYSNWPIIKNYPKRFFKKKKQEKKEEN